MARKKKDDDRPIHETLPPVTFKPMGAESSQLDQANLIAVKQSPAFPVAGGLIAHCLTMRGERVMLDYTQNAVGVRYEVDGVWVNVDPRDRQSGDAMLAVLKQLANLDPQNRRARQDGKFGAVFHGQQYFCHVTSQGVKTGERVLIKIHPKKPKFETLEELGMREAMHERLKALVDAKQGFVILSAPAGGGVTTFWNVALTAADRYVRDFVAIEDKVHPEDEIINVGPIYYDSSQGQDPADILPKLLLKQPDVFVIPDLVDSKTVATLSEQVIKHHKMVVTRVVAKDAFEALARVVAFNGPLQELAQAVTAVVSMRLVRKLCENCRQPFQPQPQLLQKLGIPADRVSVLFNHFELPPPEQRVDAKGRPIEIEICNVCGGVGYLGRTAFFELLEINDQIRRTLVGRPNDLAALRNVARQTGHRSLQEEGIVLVAKGVTSLKELQRVLKQ
jgi:type II secretory ATPase GspE/PulE/Tfp pilus assembly ATPase PilB-like protein